MLTMLQQRTGGLPAKGGASPAAEEAQPGSRSGLLGLTEDAVQHPMAVVSETIRSKIDDVDVKSAVSEIRKGAFLTKYCRNIFRKPHQRLFRVDMEVLAVKWTSKNKTSQRTQIFLTDVDRIVPGEDSDFWRKKPDEERNLGIELLSPVRNLRVVCGTVQEWKIWLLGLLYAHQKAVTKRRRAASFANDFIRKQWEMADLDQSGSIQFNELVHLLQQLNCSADVRYAEQLFDQFDEDGSCVLEYDEFRMLIYRLLTHHDIMDYFNDFFNKDTQTITREGFETFLRDVQRTPPGQMEEAAAEMRMLEEPFIKEGGLTELGFNFLMCSNFNSIMHPKKKTIYQDMNQPLSQYWVASSHNTYLTGDQVVGKSAVGQYIEVLLQGCRCVELDCWDGPDGEPIIYHGHTFTRRIPFKAVVKACRDYGFQASPFPIILSLEMHCSDKQKGLIGKILEEMIGDKIYRHKSGAPAPTPHQLQEMFIVKGRVPDEFGNELEEGNEEDLRRDEEEMQLEILTGFPDEYVTDVPVGDDRPSTTVTASSPSQKKKWKTKNPELNLYYESIGLSGRKLRSFYDESRAAMDISSLNEKTLTKMLKTSSRELAEYHQHYLSRVYPSGTRLMSSNYNPLPFWFTGCQFVALNYQAMGMATLLNYGRFRDNGGCGYILKPDFMRMQELPFDPSNAHAALSHSQEGPVEIAIQILAAQQLPRPSTDNKRQQNKRKDISCPFVTVTMHGLPEESQTFRTPHATNNGLNPRWKDQIFTFATSAPSIAILTFEVRHYDAVRSDYLAGTAFPVSSIRTGIRWVGLCDAKLREIQWSGLIVLVSMKRPGRRAAHVDNAAAIAGLAAIANR